MSARFVTTAAGLIAGCFAAGALAGCMASRTLTVMGDHGLHYVDMGQSAKLAWGPENAEAVGLMLECAKGSDEIELSDIARGGAKMSLMSGGKRSDFTGEIEVGPDAQIFYAKAGVASPALVGFRQTGRIDVKSGKTRYTMTARGGEEAAVAQFFSACEAAV